MTCKEYNDFVRKAKIVKDDICVGRQCCDCELKDPYNHHPCYVSNSGFTEEQFNFIKDYDLTDWSKVPIDAKIVVFDFSDSKTRFHRHFAGYENGVVYAWDAGQTSFTSSRKVAWKYAELYKEQP